MSRIVVPTEIMFMGILLERKGILY